MEFEFDPAKDEANRLKHGLPLDFGLSVFAAEDHVILPSFRDGDAEERYKAIGQVDGKLYTAAKSNTLFAGAAKDLLPWCGKTV